MLYEDDSDQMEDDEDDQDDFVDIGMDPEPTSAKHKNEEEFPYEVLTTEQIVRHMVDCIKEVNTVVQVCKQGKCCTFSFCYPGIKWHVLVLSLIVQ